MKLLNDALEELTSMLANIVPLPPAFVDMRLLELGPGAKLDPAGRVRVSRSMLQTKEQYEARFAELLGSYPWINVSAYGMLDRTLIVGVEYGARGTMSNRQAVINYSGPTNRVLDQNWDVRAFILLDE